MLGLTDRDRQEIRTGRNWTIGEKHARLLFWGPVWGRLLGYAVAVAAVVWLLVKAHNVWVGGLDRAVYGVWPLVLLGAAFAVGVVALAFPRSPRRRRRRRRRW